MLSVSHLTGFGAGGGVATVSKTANATNDANLTAYTFSSQALGAAASNRKIVVVASGVATATPISSLTVGGVSASVVKEAGTGNAHIDIWQADVPTGTTGDVVVTWSAGVSNCGIGVFAVIGAAAEANDTGTDVFDPLNDTLNIPAGGVAIGGAFSAAGTGTFVWTNLTEKYDEQFGAEATTHSGASDAFGNAQSALSITCDVTGESGDLAMALASWGPR